MQHHVFLSYSRKDSATMQRIYADLRAAGLTVWVDESIEPGTSSWKRIIQDAIDGAGCLVVLLSPDSKNSEWVEKEMDYATAQHIWIVPVMASGDEASAIPFALIGTQFVDIRTDYAGGVKKLVSVIKEHLQNKPLEAAAPATTSHTAYNMPEAETLDPWNFSDQARLILWLFLQPSRVNDLRMRGGENAIRQTAAWIVGGVAWFPFIMTAAGTVIGAMGTAGNSGYLVIAGLLYLAGWFITARYGGRQERAGGLGLLVLATVIALVGYVLAKNFAGVTTLDGTSSALPFVLISTCISIGGASGLAFRLANSATGTLAGTVIATLIFAALAGQTLGIIASVAGLVMLGMAFGVSYALEGNLRTGCPSKLGYWMLAIILGDYALMIWAYFLGGWHVLNRG